MPRQLLFQPHGNILRQRKESLKPVQEFREERLRRLYRERILRFGQNLPYCVQGPEEVLRAVQRNLPHGGFYCAFLQVQKAVFCEGRAS